MVDVLIVVYNKRRYDVLVTDTDEIETSTYKFDSWKRANDFVENEVREELVIDSVRYQFLDK